MKILNLYAGIGGNRELWGNEHEITAVEFDPKIAKKYQERFPNDTVIVGDAHEYLLDNHQNFDFIWTSPPCQTHSRANYFINNGVANRPRYPKMELYQEIIFLQQFAKCKFIVENVISYYEPMIRPQKIGRHYVWANFHITDIDLPKGEVGTMMKQYAGTKKHAHSKKLEDRNAVNSNLGLHILNCAFPKKQRTVQTENFACRQLSFA